MDAQNGSFREMKPFSFLKNEQRKQIKTLDIQRKIGIMSLQSQISNNTYNLLSSNTENFT